MKLPQTMMAIAISRPGGPEVLRPERRPLPVPAEGELLVRVAAAGVNRPDVSQRQGRYPPPPGASDLPGLEVAGEVVATGASVSRWRTGDKITALIAGGGYAEFAVVPEATALPIPAALTMAEAAALPETVMTVWHNVFERGKLNMGETMLVHGGASGIGTTAIQLAVARGACVVATAGSQEKCAVCCDLGATRAVNYRTEDFVSVVHEVTSGCGVDVIVDMVGGDYVGKNFAAAAQEGRIVQIAFLKGSDIQVDLRPLIMKRLMLTGSTLRPRPLAFKAALADTIRREVWPLIEAGTFRPVLDSSFPLAEAAAAHARMESGAHIGKIVLTA